MKQILTRALGTLAITLLSLTAVIAQDTPEPKANPLGKGLYVLQLDALCGVGKTLSQGCQAIRDREILDAAASPWRAIGRVNFASTDLRQHCTGTLVSERIVLTAAHCLYNAARKTWIRPQSIRFVAGYQRGRAQAVSETLRYVVDAAQNTKGRNFLGDTSKDWALLILKEPIGRQLGVLKAEILEPNSAKNADFASAGYPALRPHVLSLASACGAPDDSLGKGLLLQRCAIMHGDSGAPALVFRDGEPRVIGVISGATSKRSEFHSVAIPVASFATELERQRIIEAQ